jgi:hemerythrin
MTLITWTEEQFGTHISEIDDQHQQLFQLLDALHETLAKDEPDEIGKQLDAFVDLVVQHFQTEEHLMRENDYPEMATHKAEHDELLKMCAELLQGFHEQDEKLSQASTVFIKEWLMEHVPNFDKAYGSYLNRVPPKSPEPTVTSESNK